MPKKIIWTENQWDVFFSLENCFKRLLCVEVLAGEDPLKTLRWIVESIHGYRITLDEMTAI
jgi:hypothetical protein